MQTGPQAFFFLEPQVDLNIRGFSSNISGLDHYTCLSYLVLGFVHLVNCTWSPQDQSQSQFLHTRSKRKAPKHKQKAGSQFYTQHDR